MKDGMYAEYWELACKVVDLADEEGRLIETSSLAADMFRQLDPEKLTPDIVAYGARRFCVQMLGKVCRDRWGTVSDPLGEQFKTQLEFKEFGSHLQQRYPVPIANNKTGYKHLDELTELEGMAIVERYEVIGGVYFLKGDQLRRYIQQKFRRTGNA